MAKRLLRTNIASWVSLVAGLLLAIAIILILVFHTDFFASWSGRIFSQYFLGGTGFSIKIEKISGNPLSRIEMENIRMIYNGTDYSFDVVRIERLGCRYDARSLFSGRPAIMDLELDTPHVWIKPDSSGNNIIPFVGRQGKGTSNSFEIGNFKVMNGQIIYQRDGKADAIKEIDLTGSILSNNGQLQLSLTSGRGEIIGRKIVFKRLRGDIARIGSAGGEGDERSWSGNSLRLDNIFMELEKSSLTINGTFDPESIYVDLNVDAAPLDVEEITRALGMEYSYFGELQGTFDVRGVPDALRINGVVNGTFSGYALDGFNMEMEWIKPELRLVHGWGRFNGAVVDGHARILMGEETLMDLEAAVEELDLSAGFVRGETVPETFFDGLVRLGYSSKTKILKYDLDLSRGHLMKFPFEAGVIVGTYSEGLLEFDRLYFESPTHKVEAYGSIDTSGAIRIFADLVCSREDTLFNYFNIDDYRAGLDIAGVWEGDLEDWEMIASGRCADFRYKMADVPGGDVNLILRNNGGFQFFMEMHGDSCNIGPAGFSEMDLSLEFIDGVTRIKRLYLGRENITAEMGMEVSGTPENAKVKVEDLVLETLGEKWVGSGESMIEILEDGKLVFRDLQLHSRLGALYFDCVVDRPNESIEGGLKFDRLGLSLLNSSGLVRGPMTGRVKGSISWSGNLEKPDITLEMFASSGSFDSLMFDSVKIAADYRDAAIFIDTLAVNYPQGRINIAGSMKGADLYGYIRGKEGSMGGITADLRAECGELSLKPFFSMARRPGLAEGYFTGIITVADSIVHPAIGMNGTIMDLRSAWFNLPRLVLDAGISSMGMKVEGYAGISQLDSGSFRGRIPLRNEKFLYSIDRDKPFDFEFRISDGDLSNVTNVTEHLAEAAGRYSAGFRMGGTLNDPDIVGELKLVDAGFRFSGMEERYRGVQASIQLEDTMITVTELGGSEGKDGKFSIKGGITLDGWKPRRYDLKASLDRMLVASIPDVMAIVTGNLAVGTRFVGGRSVPSISGKLDVNRAEVYFDMGELSSSEGTGAQETPGWLAEIELEAGGNTWIKTPDANVEMQGNVTIHHDQRGTYLRGSLDLIRGWYTLYNNKFKVTGGKFEFVRAEGVRPIVDIEAETLDPEGRKIYLTLSWHQDDIEPVLSLRHEDAGYSETDIWKMLGGGVVGTDAGEGTSWDALNTAQNLAANYFERMLNSQMQGITIELETSSASEDDETGADSRETVVAIGKYLSEGLYVKYKQGLSISTARHFEVEYRLSRLFQIRSEVIMYSEKLIQGGSRRSSDEYNVDLKLRWEF